MPLYLIQGHNSDTREWIEDNVIFDDLEQVFDYIRDRFIEGGYDQATKFQVYQQVGVTSFSDSGQVRRFQPDYV